MAGSASYASGVFTVNGCGADIWGASDQFNYVSQPLTGDGSIVARVTSQSDTDPWAKAGVMIKQSTASGSPYALLAVTPGNGVQFEYGYNTSVGGESYTFPNALAEADPVPGAPLPRSRLPTAAPGPRSGRPRSR